MNDLNINDFEGLKAWPENKWVVITPTGKSELGDILFETCAYDLALQLFGGLEKRRVFLITGDKQKAVTTAQQMLDVQSGVMTTRIAALVDAVHEAHAYFSARNLGDNADKVKNKLAKLVAIEDLIKSADGEASR